MTAPGCQGVKRNRPPFSEAQSPPRSLPVGSEAIAMGGRSLAAAEEYIYPRVARVQTLSNLTYFDGDFEKIAIAREGGRSA